jgi:hypothetical protein
LDSLRTQDSAITARLSSTGSWTEKVTIGSLLSSSTLLNGFALQMAEKRALLVAALIDALNSLYVVWSRTLEDKLLVLRQKIVTLSGR